MHPALKQNGVRLRACAMALTLTCVGFAAASIRAEDEAKEVKERILFVSDREAPEEFAVYTMNPDGSEQTRVPTGPGIAYDPSWSPDHRQIVYCSVPTRGAPSSNIVMRKADGSDPVLLVVGEERTVFLSPSWSPDGAHLAYTAIQVGDGKLDTAVYVADANGKNRKRLGEGIAPIWSPDSKRLLFSAPPEGQGPPDLRIMDADGAHVETLPAKGIGGAWSPDGKHIAFTGEGDGRPNVFVMDADGKNITRLTKDAEMAAMGPSWTPDGKRLLFTRTPKDMGEKLKAEVCLMDADGSNVKVVTKDNSFIGVGMSLALLRHAAK